jgi:hypothetical protein
MDMVALSVRFPDRRPVKCTARLVLFKAQAALERRALIECGCYLREAVRAWLEAECVYFTCLPKTRRPAPPVVLAKALIKAGELHPDFYEQILEIIKMGNEAAHVTYVKPQLLECGILMTHRYLDGSPYLIAPKAGGRV